MNKAIRVLLINLAAVATISLLIFLAFGSSSSSDFLMGLGLVCLAFAALDLFISLILFITGKHNYEIAKGFLLSSGVLFLVGFAACSFTSINLN
jgi:hypothetical protein